MEPHTDEKHPPGSARELLHLALPLIVSSGSVSLMHVIDRVFLTWYSSDALAAAMPAGVLHWTAISVAMGTALYANTFVAQYEGAKRKDRVAAAIWQGIYLSLLAGTVMLVLAPLSRSIFAAIGHDASVQTLEADYFGILCLGGVPMVLAGVLSCFFSGRGRTIVIMWVSMTASAVNMILDYCFIFGLGPCPQWGIQGAAAATVIANFVSVFLYVWLVLRKPVSQEYQFWANRRFDRELFLRFVRYGLPNGLQFLIDISAFALFILLIGKLGSDSLAASNLAFNVNTLAFIPLMGLGTAVMILVGRRIGEGRPQLAVRTTWIAFGLSGSCMALFAILYVALPDIILAPYAAYTDAARFAAIREQVVILLRFVALFAFFDAMAIVFGSAVRGAGDTRFSLVFSCLSGWSLMVVPTFAVWFWYGGSLVASWTACTAYIIVLGVGFLIRFQTGQWQTMRVIETDAETNATGTEEESHGDDNDNRELAGRLGEVAE